MRIAQTLMVVCGMAFAAQGGAQPMPAFPSKPIRWIIPYVAGGSNDIMGRIVAQRLTDRMGQQVVVDNRASGGGVVAAEIVARAVPDGYTILLANAGPNAINPGLRAKLPYAPEDFAGIILLGSSPIIIVVGATFPARSVRELIVLAKSRPGRLTSGSGGTGSTVHLALEVFKTATGTDILHVPYKGTALAITDVAGGQTDMMFTTSVSAQAHIASGRLRVLAVAGPNRLNVLPDVPTLAESAVRDADVLVWFGAAAPRATPKPVIARLNREMSQVLQMAEVRERFATLGAEVHGGTPAEFDAYIRAEVLRWGRVIRSTGIKGDV